jgi:nucleotide-binding universal stress UspA family protein
MMQAFANVLFVATPGVDDATAFARAIRLAEENHERLTVVDPLQSPAMLAAGAPEGIPGEQVRVALAQASAERLQAYADAADGRVDLNTRTLEGIGFVEVIRAAQSGAHDLVMKAAEPGSRRRLLFSSFDMHLLRKCPVPVWLVKPGPSGERYRRVLAPVDVDPEGAVGAASSLNRRILGIAAAQALADGAELHVAHVWQPAYEGILRSRGMFAEEAEAQRYIESERRAHRTAFDRLGEDMRSWIGDEAFDWLKPVFHLRQGVAAAVIPEVVEELGAGLVVMGTVGRTGIEGMFIGNTAETILEEIACSVLAVKPPGFRSPIHA